MIHVISICIIALVVLSGASWASERDSLWRPADTMLSLHLRKPKTLQNNWFNSPYPEIAQARNTIITPAMIWGISPETGNEAILWNYCATENIPLLTHWPIGTNSITTKQVSYWPQSFATLAANKKITPLRVRLGLEDNHIQINRRQLLITGTKKKNALQGFTTIRYGLNTHKKSLIPRLQDIPAFPELHDQPLPFVRDTNPVRLYYDWSQRIPEPANHAASRWHDDLGAITWTGGWNLNSQGITGDSHLHWPQSWLERPRQKGFPRNDMLRLPSRVLAGFKGYIEPEALEHFLSSPSGRLFWEQILWSINDRIDPERTGLINQIIAACDGEIALFIHKQHNIGLGFSGWVDFKKKDFVTLRRQLKTLTTMGFRSKQAQTWELTWPQSLVTITVQLGRSRLGITTHPRGIYGFNKIEKTFTADNNKELIRARRIWQDLPRQNLLVTFCRIGDLSQWAKKNLDDTVQAWRLDHNTTSFIPKHINSLPALLVPYESALDDLNWLSWISPTEKGVELGDRGLLGGFGYWLLRQEMSRNDRKTDHFINRLTLWLQNVLGPKE